MLPLWYSCVSNTTKTSENIEVTDRTSPMSHKQLFFFQLDRLSLPPEDDPAVDPSSHLQVGPVTTNAPKNSSLWRVSYYLSLDFL